MGYAPIGHVPARIFTLYHDHDRLCVGVASEGTATRGASGMEGTEGMPPAAGVGMLTLTGDRTVTAIASSA